MSSLEPVTDLYAYPGRVSKAANLPLETSSGLMKLPNVQCYCTSQPSKQVQRQNHHHLEYDQGDQGSREFLCVIHAEAV
jgi:hypothetical protein